MRLNRVIKILLLIANDNNLTVRMLADKFDVSRKTIYQDLNALILSGIPVLYGENYKGTVKIMEGFNFPKAFAKEIVHPHCPLIDDVYIKYLNDTHVIKDTYKNWERFTQRRQINSEELPQIIYHSWIRCQQKNVPICEIDLSNILAPTEISNYSIERFIEGNTDKAHLLLEIFKQLGWFAAIYDNEGQLKHIINPFTHYERLYPQMGYLLNINEERVGTTSSYLALSENRTVMVRGAEHYNKAFHEGTCIATPLYKNKIRYGVLNVSFVHTYVNPQVMNIVNTFARLYEAFILNQHPIDKEAEKRLYGEDFIQTVKNIPSLYGRSLHWKRVMSMAVDFSTLPHHLTVIGPKGVGKKSIAKFIHAKGSRKYGPCYMIDGECLDTDIWHEEIFGVETKEVEKLGIIEKAEGGVIIIRYPHKLPTDIQLALAHYLKTSKIRRMGSRKQITFDTRIMMTLTDLQDEGLIDALRDEMTLTLSIQPLKNRKEDVEAIYRGWYQDNNIKKDTIEIRSELMSIRKNALKYNGHQLREIYENNN